MSIIIVGNGPTLLDKDNGRKIDNFDIVVRFNAYSIEGFEIQVGTKTDFWFNTVNFQNKQKESRLNKHYKRVIWHSWQWDDQMDKAYQEFVEFFSDKDVNLSKIVKETTTQMCEYVDDMTYVNYSTGAIAIWMLVKEFGHVTITGFDWWESLDKHHYNDNARRGTLHKPEKEMVLIGKLIFENKLSILN
jgi:hypothetical protein